MKRTALQRKTPLKRGTPMRRTPMDDRGWQMIRKDRCAECQVAREVHCADHPFIDGVVFRRPKEKRSGRIKDPLYLRAVRRLPCSARGVSPCSGRIHADHAGLRPTGRKCDDYETIPLCAHHHEKRTHFWEAFKTWTGDQMAGWLVVQIRNTQAKLRAMIPLWYTFPVMKKLLRDCFPGDVVDCHGVLNFIEGFTDDVVVVGMVEYVGDRRRLDLIARATRSGPHYTRYATEVVDVLVPQAMRAQLAAEHRPLEEGTRCPSS